MKIRIKESVSILSCVLFGMFALYYAKPISAVLYVKWQARTRPELRAVPQPLPTSSIDNSPGRRFSYFGYEFELPWSDLPQERMLESVVVLNFANHTAISLFDQSTQPDSFSTLREIASKRGTDIGTYWGDQAASSRYGLLARTLTITPSDLGLFSSRQRMVGDSMLLLIKGIQTRRYEGRLYSFVTSSYRGFQEGSPEHDRAVIIQAFDGSDHEVEIWISTKPNEKPVSQAEVNRLLFSLHPVTGSTHQP